MRKYEVIGLMYTRSCPLACAHCITESSPQVKERMRLQHARTYVQAIARFGSMLCFTGGEPFLYHREVATLIGEAKSFGLETSIVTGAGWVRGESRTRARIAEMVEAGLNDLCISWDQYHEAFSNRERAVMLARIATEAGLSVKVRSVISATRSSEEDHQAFAGLPVELQTNQLVQLGRAESLPASHFLFSDEPPKGVCSVVFSPIVEPDGKVYACCGPSHYSRKPSPLFLGDAAVEPLDDILQRGLNDPILEIIYNLGPYGLYHLLMDEPIGRERFEKRQTYSGICELCLDITGNPELVQVLRERLSGKDAQRLVLASALWRKERDRAKSVPDASQAPCAP